MPNSQRGTALDRVAFKMKLHPGQEAEYRRRHDAIWPELAALLAVRGIRDYSIFLDPETHVLFALYRRTPGARLDDLADEPVMRRWWDHMADIMDTNPDHSPVQAPLALVFHLD